MNFKASQILLKRKAEKKLADRIILDAPHLGEIACGTVVPFIPKSELVPVVVPEGTHPGDIATLTVRGISLTDRGIRDGDLLILRRKFSWRDIKEDTICAVYIHSTGELCAKRILRGANVLVLRASGGGLPDKVVSPDDIEIKGIVFAVQRPIEEFIEVPF